MPELSNLPIKTKYTPEDRVYVFDLTLQKILPVIISEWRVEVDNPLNDSTGRQIIYYKFKEVPYEFQEKYVFASENSVLAWMKNDYFNRAIESTTGGNNFFKSGLNTDGDARSFGNWTDFAGWDMTEAQFKITGEWIYCDGTATIAEGSPYVVGTGTHFLTDFAPGDFFELSGGGGEIYGITATVLSVTDDTHLILNSHPGEFTDQFVMKVAPDYPIEILEDSGGEKTLVFDYCRLGGATLPDSIADPADSWADFRAGVRSYDADTTIMPDGMPIGRP